MAVENVPLAIVGIGCLFPRADGAGAFWANIKQGVDCVGPVPATHWKPEDYFDHDPKTPDMTYATRGAFLEAVDFNPLEFGISPVDLEAIDTSQLLGLVATRQALNDAGYGPDKKYDKSCINVILGVTGTLELVIPLGARLGHPKWKKALANAGVDEATAKQVVDEIADSYVPWQENSFPGLLGNVVAGRIANKLDLGGTNCVVDAACASSLSAIHLASLELAAGRCDVAVTGGVDTFNDIFMFMCFSKTPALSKSGDAKPFDANGDGTILGEGLGIVVLKRLADAERDGDRVYAVIKAIGTSSDGKGNAVYAPSAEGQTRALKNAYQLADVSPATIELIEAHGTGTKVGDSVEATALAEVFRQTGSQGTWCAVGSVKSMIGHTKAAAGAAGLIKATLALYNKVLPPTLKVKTPVEPLQPGTSPFYVNLDKRPWLPNPKYPRRAGLSAFGFGGSNFHAVLEEHRSAKVAPDWDGRTQIVALAGASVADLTKQLADLPTHHWGTFCTKAAATRQAFQAASPMRLLLVVQHDADLSRIIAAANDKLAQTGEARSWSLPEGVYFGRGPATGLGVLFPGQGAQSTGMLRDLACTFPEMLNALALAEDEWAAPKRLVDYIYPHSIYNAEQRAEAETQLRATNVAQPAIGAVAAGAWDVFRNFGVKPSAVAGHSFGELVALYAAEAIDAESLHRLARERGRLMAAQQGDAGTMLAVHAPLAEVEQILKQQQLNLVIANRNSPNQCVLSGATSEIANAEGALQKARLRSTRLPVAAAFHSPLVAQASVPFRELLEEISFRRPACPVYANTTGQPYPTSTHDARDLLANQLAKPVEFVQTIQNMVAAGVRTFVEIGPGSILTRLTEATLKTLPQASECDCFALDASNSKKSGVADLAHALARLAALGHTVQLPLWEAGQRYPAPTAKPGLTVPICGANYVKPRTRKEPSNNGTPIAKPKVSGSVDHPVRPAPVSRIQPLSKPMSETPNNPSDLSAALAVTQQSLLAFQRMQEETARLHKQFLDNQQAALATLQTLVVQQHTLLTGGAVPPLSLPAIPVPAPAPAYVPPPAPVYTPPVMSTPAPVAVVPPPPPPTPAPAPTPKVATPAPVTAPAKKPAAGPSASTVLLAVVAEKTGYPAEMLGLDMALDADLGIDSIKRVEILSALQEKLPNAPAVKPEHLGTLHTLRDIVSFLGESGSGIPASSSEPDLPPTSFGMSATSLTVPTPTPTSATSDPSGVLLAVVAEKTGYPAEMLGLDMALDADLGIDSIKRVEILSALQEKLPNAPAVKPEHLGTLHTLRDIVSFLIPAPESSPPETQRPFVSALTLASNEGERQTSSTVDIVVPQELPPTAYVSAPKMVSPKEKPAPIPPSYLGMDSRMDGDPATPDIEFPPTEVVRSVIRSVLIDPSSPRRKVKLDKFAPFWLIAEPSSMTAKISQHLDAAGCRPQFIAWNDSPYAYEPKGLAGLVLIAPESPVPDDLPIRAFRWLKRAAPALAESARATGALFATITRFDGQFGWGDLDGNRDPVQAALLGMVKTAAHEWPNIACKAIDIDPRFSRNAAAALVEEVLTAGPIEVGLTAQGRFELELVDTPAVLLSGEQGSVLKEGSVVVVTGGARGVTAEALFPLVRAIHPKLVLLGRTASPEPEPDWLVRCCDANAIKQALITQRGKTATPKEIGEECKRILAQREMRTNLERLSAAGASVQYLPTDVQDAGALAAALADIRRLHGPIDVLIHGAGVLADKRIEELTDDQFKYVYATKVGGMKNLLASTEEDPLKAIVLFSSSTGRFGRLGQLAYAAANEVLNKTAQRLNRVRPRCRTVAINWGPWAGGMVTPALAQLFESEGIGLIPFKEGGDNLWQEINASDRPAETVVIAKPASPKPTANQQPVAHVPTAAALTQVFARQVSLFDHVVLRSHVINEKAVVPLVLHAEWMGHAALHSNPGYKFLGFDELRVFHAINVDEVNPASITLWAGTAKKQGDYLAVPVEIRSRKDKREVIHSRCDIVLANQLPEAGFAGLLPETGPFRHTPDEAYDYYLFHGDLLRAIERVDGIGDAGAFAYSRTAPAPEEWMNNPVRGAWLADPLALDAAFQLLILWSYHKHRRGSLPCYVGKYRQFRKSFPTDGVLIAVTLTRDNGTMARANIEFIDNEGRLVAQMTDAEHVIDPSLNEAFRRGRLAQPTGHSASGSHS